MRTLGVALRTLTALLVLTAACAKVPSPVADLSERTWSVTEPMAQGRIDHTATSLRDGRLLVVGGDSLDGALWTRLASAELFDPSTGAWSSTGSLALYRSGHTATRLADGSVLVAGGHGGAEASVKEPLREVELYKPYAGRWTPSPSMHEARYDHTATLLADGRVLVVGGEGPSGVAGCELFSPVTGRWLPLEPMGTPRRGHTAVELGDGRILVAGGLGNAGVLAAAEIFDPSNNTWTQAAPMATPRDGHAAALLVTGEVLVAGGYTLEGYTEAELSSAELYDPKTDTWRPAPSLHTARRGLDLVAWGPVWVALGGSLRHNAVREPEVFDVLGGATWTRLPELPESLYGAATATLPGGRVVAVGGWDTFDRQSATTLILGG